MNINLPLRHSCVVNANLSIMGIRLKLKTGVVKYTKMVKNIVLRLLINMVGGISKSKYRDMRICSVLNEKEDEVLYHLYLSRPGKMETALVYIDLGKSELKIGGDGINVIFKCKSLEEAENEPNKLEVAPVNILKDEFI